MPKSPSTTTRFYLVRHGQVESAWRGRLYGCHDVELSRQGQREAQSAADQLHAVDLAAVISSGLRRAEFGAACIRANRTCPRRDDSDLRELERGSWVGMRPQETPGGGWEKWHAAPHEVRPPGGENLVDLAARVLPRMEAHAADYPDRSVALVAHSWVLRVVACYALSLALAKANYLRVPTGSILVVDWPNRTGEQAGYSEPLRWGTRRGGRQPVMTALGPDALPPSDSGWFRGPRQADPA